MNWLWNPASTAPTPQDLGAEGRACQVVRTLSRGELFCSVFGGIMYTILWRCHEGKCALDLRRSGLWRMRVNDRQGARGHVAAGRLVVDEGSLSPRFRRDAQRLVTETGFWGRPAPRGRARRAAAVAPAY